MPDEPDLTRPHVALPPATRAGKPLTRVLAAGGAGFVGSHVCDALVANGVHVVCVDNLVTGRPENVAHLAKSPLFTFLEQDAAVPTAGLAPLDAVLHLASPASPQDFDRLSVETLQAGSHVTHTLLNLAVEHGARFLLASTSEVYGDALEHPQREDYWGNVNPIGPRSVYDEGKRYAESLVTAYRHRHGVDSVIVRIFNTYGPRMRPDDGRCVPNFITGALAQDALTIHGDGKQTRSLCFVDDLVRGLLAAVASGHHGPINLGNPDEDTIVNLAQRIITLCGSSSSMRFVGAAPDDPRQRCPDTSVARKVLDWSPQVDKEEGLARTIEWFRSHRPAGRADAGEAREHDHGHDRGPGQAHTHAEGAKARS
ncbi:NAD-dependent epimerase/dehydratase family protein [Streptomyces enissocaesilis]|uniref:GDP-mannose 4,6-dehydratase n=1 Tax=Streptomyces enissocaesilis TaxID=332589 RepID=A0ABN3X6C0_9ACTN